MALVGCARVSAQDQDTVLQRDALARHGVSVESGFLIVGNREAPFTCKYCGRPSWIDPSDQSPPPDYCHEIDHGTLEDRAAFGGNT